MASIRLRELVELRRLVDIDKPALNELGKVKDTGVDELHNVYYTKNIRPVTTSGGMTSRLVRIFR